MYDEATIAAYYAYCRAHPAWFVDAYLPLVAFLHERGDAAPAEAAWALVLSRAVETGRVTDVDGDGTDRAVAPLGWSPRP